jgi:hypothetical protein
MAKEIIYGDNNGASYSLADSESGTTTEHRTHWDPKLEITGFPDMAVQLGVIPASPNSTDEQGLWDSDDGQFITLSRDGCNRAIRAIRKFRDSAYGADA